MTDDNEKKDNGHRKGSVVLRILTIILALVIAGSIGYVALNYHDLSSKGEICPKNGKCITLAPGKATDVKKAS